MRWWGLIATVMVSNGIRMFQSAQVEIVFSIIVKLMCVCGTVVRCSRTCPKVL